MKLTDPVFDASTLSQNRRRRLVDGTVLYTDSTHLKANANKGKYDLEMLKKSRADYWGDLDLGDRDGTRRPWSEAAKGKGTRA